MERKQFLRGIGLVGAASLFPFSKVFSGNGNDEEKPTACTLIPTETAGPFPLDLTANTYYFRQDLREDRTGTVLNLKLKILGEDNCSPLANVRVNVWMCDKDGTYSGYATPQNPGGTADSKWLRGYQMTDANGEVTFKTIFPGWYSGRICHIHFQVYVSSSYAAISQLSFDIATKNALYAANSSLYTKGADPMTFASDNIFSDGYTYQLATLTQNTSGEYDSYLEVTVRGSGSTGIGHAEKQAAKQFLLGQNYPNPHIGQTTIPFTLKNTAEVKLDIFDLAGRKVYTVDRGILAAGDYTVDLNLNSIGLVTGNYAYQIQIMNSDGVFKDCKLMTVKR